MSKSNTFVYSTLNIGGRDALLNEKIRHAIQLRKTKPTFTNRASIEERPKTSGTSKKRSKIPNNPDITYLLNGAVQQVAKQYKRKSLTGDKDSQRDSVNANDSEITLSQLGSSFGNGAIVNGGAGLEDTKEFEEEIKNLKTFSNSNTKLDNDKYSNNNIFPSINGASYQSQNQTSSEPKIQNEFQLSPLSKLAHQPSKDETNQINESFWKTSDKVITIQELDTVSGTINNPLRVHVPRKNSDDKDSYNYIPEDVNENEDNQIESQNKIENPLYKVEQTRRAALQPFAPSGPKSSFQRFIPREKKSEVQPKSTNSIAIRLISKEIQRQKKSIYKNKKHEVPNSARSARQHYKNYSYDSFNQNNLNTFNKERLRISQENRMREEEFYDPNTEIRKENYRQEKEQIPEQIRIFIHFCIVRKPTISNFYRTFQRFPFEIDGIQITEDDNIEILMVGRHVKNNNKFYAIPGDELHYRESPEDVAVQYIANHLITKVRPILPLHLITVASRPDRDPVGHVIAHVYALKTEEVLNINEIIENDVEMHTSFEFIPINLLLMSEDYTIALDHRNLLLQFLLWFRAYGRSLL